MRTDALRVAQSVGGSILALDASTPRASVAAVILSGTPEVVEVEPDASALPSESLAASVASLIEGHDLQPSTLAAIVVGLGPGSFTGLRVALALVKGLAYGAGIPVFGVSSLALLAARFPGERVAVEIDAQRRELYTAVYEVNRAGLPGEVLADRATTREQWTAQIENLNPSLDRIIGDVEGSTAAIPRALAGILIASDALSSGKAPALDELVPRYLKVSEAERNL